MASGNGESKTFSVTIYHEKNSILMKNIFSCVLTGNPNHFLPFAESFFQHSFLRIFFSTPLWKESKKKKIQWVLRTFIAYLDCFAIKFQHTLQGVLEEKSFNPAWEMMDIALLHLAKELGSRYCTKSKGSIAGERVNISDSFFILWQLIVGFI